MRLTKLEVMIKSLVNDAARGDKKAIAMVLDQLGPIDTAEDQFAQLSAEEIAAFVARYLVPGKGAAR